MTYFRFLFLAAGIAAVCALGGVGHSARGGPPSLPAAPPPKPVADPDDAKAKKTPGRVLTPESLSEMLDSMGYDFRADTLPSGGAVYTVTVKSDTWTFVVEVSLAPNGSLVWLIGPLQQLPAPGAVPAEALERLLQENWAIYPHSFAIPKNARRLYLQRAIENQGVTPAKLRSAIDGMTGTIRATAPMWDVSKWGQTPSPDGKKGPDGAPAAYPDTAEGLTKLCKDTLALAKAGKRAEVAAKVKEMALPNHAAWFKRVFGAELGAALAEEYATGLAQAETNLTRQFMTAAEEGQTEVKAFKFAAPGADAATPTQAKIMEAMAVKTPLYSAYLTQPGEDTGMHLHSWVYADGTFRMAGKMKAATVRVSGFRGLNGFEFLEPLAPAAPRADLLGLVRADAGRATQNEERDVTGYWVHHGGPGGPRMTMQLNRNGTYTVAGPESTDTGRYAVTAGVIYARSSTGLRSRVYVSWMGPDLASFGFKPDDDTSTPTWLTFARLKPLNGAAEPNGEEPGVNRLTPSLSGPLFRESNLGFSAPNGPSPAAPVGANRLDPNDFRHLAPLMPGAAPRIDGQNVRPAVGAGGPGWNNLRPDSAACPNLRCTGGWCYKFPEHGGPHQCGTCGWTWY